MQKLPCVFIAIFLCGSSFCRAEAADGQAPFNWSGFYLGASIGLHDITTSGVFDGPELGVTPDLENIGGEGVHFVIQAGYNYQVNRFVMGVEATLAWVASITVLTLFRMAALPKQAFLLTQLKANSST